MKSKLFAVLPLGAILSVMLAGQARAITVNPASAVTADSDNTGLTIPYRDVNGAFSMGALTATSITNTGAQSAESVSADSVTIPSFGSNRIVTTGAGGALVTYSTFSITGTGVGIGVAAPAVIAHINGTAAAQGSTTGLLRISDTAQAERLDIGINAGSPYAIWFQGASTDYATKFPLAFQVDGGSVGIGTASPATKLHMSSGTLTVDGTDASMFIDASGSASPYVKFSRAGTSSMLFGSAGGAGDFVTGTTAGDAVIRVQSNDLFITTDGGTSASVVVTAGGDIVYPVTKSPASNAACTSGTFNFDANYIYYCVSSGVWKRAALTGGY